MPNVTIEMWPIKDDYKPKIIKGISDVFVELGIPKEAVFILIHETKKENWGSSGEQHSVKYKDCL